MNRTENELRVGVYVCHCGTNIAGVLDVADLASYASGLPHVKVARDYKDMCSEPRQELIRQDIAAHGLNRVVVAACSPHLHEATFRKVLAEAGLNGYLLAFANIREHVAWVARDKAVAQADAAAAQALALIDPSLCKGCGTCVAACPSGAAQQHMFSTEEILAEIEGILAV
jgi:heterodisulfide reductase subunit A